MDEIINPVRGVKLTDDQAMAIAIREARRGAGFVSPNPLVGCVIVDKENRFVSVGYHQIYGGAHAEVNALEGIPTESLKGCRLFVTLEPCAHEGKTPSCAKKIATLPLAEVIYGLIDPNPLVSGQGAKILEQAGIRTTLFGRMNDELEELCEHFLVNQREKRPFVSVKVATSLDGQMALQNGESQWITGEQSREFSHFLRGCHDATLVGQGTVLTDNPQLSIRHPQFANKKNKVLIIDDTGEVLRRQDLRIYGIHKPENLIIVTSQKLAAEFGELKKPMAQVIGVSEKVPGELNLDETLGQVWRLGIRSLFIEGGVAIISSFINEMKVDRLYLFQAPVLLGAKSGKAWTSQVSIRQMSERISLKNPKLRMINSDIMITGKLRV